MTPKLRAALFGVLALFTYVGTAQAAPVTLKAADGVEIAGDYAGSADNGRPIVLLFHMASSNRAEYRAIAPRLVAAGWDTLAIDQRSGGNAFGARNETVAKLGRSTSFGEALKDLEAALAFARAGRPGRKVVVVGSSYSASLVFLLAAAHPGEIAAVLAFSPGEYLGRDGTVKDAAKRVTVPVFVSSASDGGEIAEARAILAASPAAAKVQFVPKAGVHGASTLDPARNPRGAEEAFAALTAFLKPLGP